MAGSTSTPAHDAARNPSQRARGLGVRRSAPDWSAKTAAGEGSMHYWQEAGIMKGEMRLKIEAACWTGRLI